MYYSKYWLTQYTIDTKDDTIEDNMLVRTNNICELYNQRMIQKIAIKRPRMSILVKHLIASLSQEYFGIFIDSCSANKMKYYLLLK